MNLVCTKCKTKVTFFQEENRLVCDEGHVFKVIDGIPSFIEVDEFYEGKFSETFFDKHELTFVTALHPNNTRKKFILDMAGRYPGLTLDLGCGGGREWVKKFGFVAGIDISVTSLKNARAIYDEIIHSSIEKLPFEDSVFDNVVGIDILGHIPIESKDILLSEIKRVLKPNGRIIMIVECDSSSCLFTLAKRNKELFYEKFVRLDGHFGLEFPAQTIKRFGLNGFRIIKKFSRHSFVWPDWEYEKEFKGEYQKESILLNLIYNFFDKLRKFKLTLVPFYAWIIMGILDRVWTWMRIDSGHILFICATSSKEQV